VRIRMLRRPRIDRHTSGQHAVKRLNGVPIFSLL
jgi:hypothetical protein